MTTVTNIFFSQIKLSFRHSNFVSALTSIILNKSLFIVKSLIFFFFQPRVVPRLMMINRKNLGASTISSALNAHAGNLNGNVSKASLFFDKLKRFFVLFCLCYIRFMFILNGNNPRFAVLSSNWSLLHSFFSSLLTILS